MKLVSASLAFLFLVFAIVQLNDPDPLIWASIYLFMVALSVAAFLQKLNRFLFLLAMVPFIVMLIGLWPGLFIWIQSPDRSLIFDDIAKMQNIYIEEAREFFGLSICILSLLFYFIKSNKIKAE